MNSIPLFVDRRGAAIAVGLGLLLAGAAITLSLLRFYTLSNDNFDIGFYVRVIWGMAHGDRMHPILCAHELGLHFMPILWLFVPLSYVLPLAPTLLVANALALGACVPLLYRLARQMTGRASLALLPAVAFVLHPSTLQLGSREFHPGNLALPLLIAAFCALHAGRFRRMLLLLGAACLAREDVALVAAGAGAIFAMEHGQRWKGLLLAGAAMIWFLGYTLVIQPHFLPANGSLQAHFPHFGGTTADIAVYLITHPIVLVQTLFQKEDILYGAALLCSVAALPLLRARWLLAVAGPFLINAISAFPGSSDLRSHYVALLLPGLFCGATAGLARMAQTVAWKRTTAAVAFVFAVVAMHALYGATPASRSWNAASFAMDREEGILRWYGELLKEQPEWRVSAPAALLNHIAERRSIYSPAFAHPAPDAVVVDIRQQQWNGIDPQRWFAPMEREIAATLADPDMALWKDNPPWRLYIRKKGGGKARLAEVSPGVIPDTAVVQPAQPEGIVELVAAEGHLKPAREPFSGRYAQRITLFLDLYWRARQPLPDDLLIKAVVEGSNKTHVRWLLPTSGVRPTGTWQKGELILDRQRMTSPGGWPLDALRVTVQFATRDGASWPPGSRPVVIRWHGHDGLPDKRPTP